MIEYKCIGHPHMAKSNKQKVPSTMPKMQEIVTLDQLQQYKPEKHCEESTSKNNSPIYDLKKFRLRRILNNNTVRKSVALLGTFPDVSDQDEAIIIFEKNAFSEQDVQTPNAVEQVKVIGDTKCTKTSSLSYFNESLQVQLEFVNDIYSNFQCIPTNMINGLKTSVVYPASAKHIEKYSICQKYVISETPELYEQITLPYIQSSQFSLEWVYNILEHKQETERIVYEDSNSETGFVLLPDLKWDGRNTETLYLLAITQKRNIKSLRDLRGEHLPLLRNMRESIAREIEERYKVNASKLRFYFHYQPSFYHLHLHVNLLRTDAPGIWCEKAHMLDTVINNLDLMPNYYVRATIPFVLYEGNKLLTQYENVILIRHQLNKRQASESDGEPPVKQPKSIERATHHGSALELNKK